jgi:hypothetical protein
MEDLATGVIAEVEFAAWLTKLMIAVDH